MEVERPSSGVPLRDWWVDRPYGTSAEKLQAMSIDSVGAFRGTTLHRIDFTLAQGRNANARRSKGQDFLSVAPALETSMVNSGIVLPEYLLGEEHKIRLRINPRKQIPHT